VPPFSVAHASRSEPVHGRVAYRPSKYFINHNAARPRFSQTKLNSIPVCGLLAGPPRTLTGLISPSFRPVRGFTVQTSPPLRPVRGFTLQTSPSFRPVQLITIFTGSSNWPLTSLVVRPVRLITISTGSSSWPWASLAVRLVCSVLHPTCEDHWPPAHEPRTHCSYTVMPITGANADPRR
jgi:hypothetical protein